MYEDDASVQGEKKEETTYETHRAEADVLFKQGEYRKAEICFTQVSEWPSIFDPIYQYLSHNIY